MQGSALSPNMPGRSAAKDESLGSSGTPSSHPFTPPSSGDRRIPSPAPCTSALCLSLHLTLVKDRSCRVLSGAGSGCRSETGVVDPGFCSEMQSVRYSHRTHVIGMHWVALPHSREPERTSVVVWFKKKGIIGRVRRLEGYIRSGYPPRIVVQRWPGHWDPDQGYSPRSLVWRYGYVVMPPFFRLCHQIHDESPHHCREWICFRV